MEKKASVDVRLLLLLLAGILAAGSLCTYKLVRDQVALKEDQAQIEKLTERADKLEKRIGELKREVLEEDEKIHRYEIPQSGTETVISGRSDADALTFYEENIAILVDGGEKRYHSFGCESIDWGEELSFRVYTITSAEYQGYQPCEVCH